MVRTRRAGRAALTSGLGFGVQGIIGNITEQNRGSLPVRFLKIAREIEETLADGFTTVRDAGGLDWGYKEAIRQGLLHGPRLFVSNGVLSQTGGHGDLRPRTMADPESQTPGLWSIGIVVDGPDHVRWGAREMLRRGADQIRGHGERRVRFAD